MIYLNKFEAIIFDFGGVILDIDPPKTWDAFVQLFSKTEVKKIQNSHWLDEIEKGLINQKQLINGIKSSLKTEFTNDQFYAAWNALLLDYKSKRIQKIRELKKTHRLFMLSNTNEIHYREFSQKLEMDFGLSFQDLFIKTYLSHEMGLIKPDPKIYQQVLHEQNLIPAKTLFIEDTEINAKAAAALGINTLVIPQNGNFYNYIK